MLIDDKGRILGKISFIDILLVLVVLAAGLFGLNKFGLIAPQQTPATSTNKVEIVFYQEEVNDFTANNVKIGDPATESLKNANFGKVIDVKVGESISWLPDLGGNKIVSSSREGYASIYITMEANANITPNGINVGGYTFYVGDIITLRAGNSIFYGRIYSANEI